MRIPWADGEVPFITTEQMVEVDRAMIEDFGIDLARMMENAGRNLAHLARERFLDGDPRDQRIVVMAGTGGNGGGALVAARRLHGYGAQVTVRITRLNMAGVPGEQLAMLRAIGISVAVGPPVDVAADLVIDGVIGYSLSGSPRGVAADLITWANAQPAPILSLDVPSGLDTTSGVVGDPAVRAAATMTLALPKAGLREAREMVGELYLADISVPNELYAQAPLHLDVQPLFASSDIIRIY